MDSCSLKETVPAPERTNSTDLLASGSEPVTVHRERSYLPYLNPESVSSTHFIQSLRGGQVLIVGAT